MKIIGTGLSGLVGSRIVELLEKQFEFIDFSLEFGIDITDCQQLERAFRKNKGALGVIHLAAFTDVDKAHLENGDKKGICYKVNVLGTRNVAQFCQEYGKYLIHISTDFVFSGNKKTAYTEKDSPDPIEWYGQTKAWAEEEVGKSGCQNVILRIAFPFKAKPSPPRLEPKVKLDLVRKFLKKLKKGEKVSAFSDQIITPTFIDDIARVFKVVVKKRPQGIYHLVGSSSLSPFKLSQKVAHQFNLDKSLIKKAFLKEYFKGKSRPRQKNLAISNQKLKKELKIKLTTIDEALKTMAGQLEK